MKKKYIASITVIGIILSALYVGTTLFASNTSTSTGIPQPSWIDGTIVMIDPSNMTVSNLNIFSVNISCSPTEPIKAFEFRISFNSSLLQANSVTEGDIFEGYDTYFSSGIINNTAGTIIYIYNLILGIGNVSHNGTLVTINFTAKDTGTSELNLSWVGVTNETIYLPIIVYNCSVQIEDETTTYAMALNKSWNLKSWPVPVEISKSDITVLYNNTFYTWQEACNSTIILKFIYMYPDDIYELAESFSPYFGYWIYSYYDEVVLIYEQQ